MHLIALLFISTHSQLSSEQHSLGVLDELLELLAPQRGNGSIDDPMIAAQGHIHHVDNLKLLVAVGVIVRHDLLEGATDGQDASLRRVDDRAEVVHAVHAEVRDGEGAALQLSRLELVLAGASGDIFDLGRNGLETLEVGVLYAGRHEAVVGLDGEAHVDVRELSDVLLLPRAVGLGHLDGSGGRGLDDEVIDRQFRLAHLVELTS